MRDTRERRSDLPIAVGGKDLDRPSDGHRRRLRVHCHRCDSMLIVGIDERSKAPRLWQELVQEPDPLRGELRIGKADARDVDGLTCRGCEALCASSKDYAIVVG